jgi:hypothetical protein
MSSLSLKKPKKAHNKWCAVRESNPDLNGGEDQFHARPWHRILFNNSAALEVSYALESFMKANRLQHAVELKFFTEA